MTDRLIGIGFKLYIVLGFAFIFAPIVSLMVFAFNEDRFPSLPWKGFSTKWFEAVFATPEFTNALKNSLVVGGIVAVIATFLGGTAAYFLNRWDFKGKGVYLGIAVLPPCIPLVILGLALLIYLKEIGLSGSLTSVVISHVVLASAFALGIVRMRLTEMDADARGGGLEPGRVPVADDQGGRAAAGGPGSGRVAPDHDGGLVGRVHHLVVRLGPRGDAPGRDLQRAAGPGQRAYQRDRHDRVRRDDHARRRRPARPLRVGEDG